MQAPVRTTACFVLACALGSHHAVEILAAQGGSGEPRLWFLSLVAGERYPDAPPTIKFESRVNLDCVDSSGNVRARVCFCLAVLRAVGSLGLVFDQALEMLRVLCLLSAVSGAPGSLAVPCVLEPDQIDVWRPR